MVEADNKPSPAGERLAKVIARSGLCSRRDAERWIEEGRVNVDGKTVRTPATNVTEDQTVLVDGQPLAARHGTRLWLYHKPAGLVVTEKDPEGRETIFERLEEEGLPRVLTVGRLDINTEGLLLLTNDGGLKRVLELPATGWLRKYRVRAFGSIDQGKLDTVKNGMTVDGVSYGPIEATLERVQGGNVWLLVSLREGKNREVKNVLGALGLQVNRLIRVSYGPFQLGDLPIGAVTMVKAKVLRDQLGARLAKEAGVDFDSAYPEETEAKDVKVPARSARDPNARLRQTPERVGKKQAAPKPRTGEPKYAKTRAQNRDAAPPRGGRFGEDRPAPTRRVLFDDGRELIEDAPRRPREKPEFGGDDRPPRRGDRPERAGGREDRREGGRSDRPRKPFGARDGEVRGRSDDRGGRGGFGGGRKFDGDRPRGPRPDGERGGDARPARRDRPDREGSDRKSFGSRPSGPRPARAEGRPGRSFDDRPAGRSGGEDRPRGPRPDGKPARSFGDKPRGPRPDGKGASRPGNASGGRPSFGGKPSGGRPAGGKPSGGRPGGSRPGGGRPTGGKPSTGPRGGGKPRTPRS